MRIKSLLTSLLLLTACLIYAQTQHGNDTLVFSIVEEPPIFPGGDTALVAYLTHNLHYPPREKEKGIQGKAFVGFVIEKDSAVTNVEAKRGIAGGCDEEAIRVVKMIPNWIPGEVHGKKVKVQYFLPFNFTLPKEQPEQIINNQRRNTF